MGTTCAYPPPAAPPFRPNVGPCEGWQSSNTGVPKSSDRLGESDGGLSFTLFGWRHRRDDYITWRSWLGVPLENIQVHLGLVAAIEVELVLSQAAIGSNIDDRPQDSGIGDLQICLRHQTAPIGCLVSPSS
jgi:hypothetical protein